MKNAMSLIKRSLLGGVAVLFPIMVLAVVYDWLYKIIVRLIKPFHFFTFGKTGILANAIVILIIVLFCFFIGLLMKTKTGKFYHDIIESKILLRIPGYSFIKETGLQLFMSKKTPFSQVVLVNVFGNDTLVTAFIVDEHENGTVTVFAPHAPSPTSGQIYHINNKYVHPIDISIEDAIRSIISCGNGSKKLINQYFKQVNKIE